MTPQPLADYIIEQYADDIWAHSKSSQGFPDILDPCCGEGAFWKALARLGRFAHVTQFDVNSEETAYRKDFFIYEGQYLAPRHDWIISNPPWSKYRDFTKHAYTLTDNILWLITINHVLALKARLRDMKEANFGIRRVLCVDTPKENWPQSGFQLGAVKKKLSRTDRMDVGIVLYTSTKGHFGYKGCYLETVDNLKREFPTSGALFNPNALDQIEKFAHIKISPDEDHIFKEMENNLRQRDFSVLCSEAEWSHDNVSHAREYYKDMLKTFSDYRVLQKELVLFIEDDWLVQTGKESMLLICNYALTFMRKHPEKLCIRINRDIEKPADYIKTSEQIWTQGEKYTPYGPTMTFQPTFVRPREWYHALRWINAASDGNDKLFEQIHCELISGNTMKVFSDDPLPFCFFNPEWVSAEHIGEEDLCKSKLKEESKNS